MQNIRIEKAGAGSVSYTHLDRGMFFSALITPGILILLYATFLANVYRDSFVSAIPDMITISDKLVDGTVAAQLAAALLAVSCVTVTFCVNLTMVQDRANGTRTVSYTHLLLFYFFYVQRRMHQ